MTQMKFIGLDVHKETVAVAIADATRDGEVRFYGTIPNSPEAIRRLFDRLSDPSVELYFCYEAGGCGYGIYRQLQQLGASCSVIAPSMMPKKRGDRIKNDRRDAVTLARLLRAGELTAIWVPDESHEAMRDLVRARRQAKGDLVAARQMLLGFLLRHGRKFPGKTNWTRLHWRWLGEQAFGSPHQQFVFGECIRRIEEAQARCDRLDHMLQEAMESWPMAPLVKALQALRGVGLVIAATLVTEIGDLARFQTPKHLMGWLGLVPSEASSGARTRRGAITKTGNGEARAMLVEAAWSYRLPAREERRYRMRVEHLPEEIRAIGWKAQARLCQRYRRLSAAGKIEALKPLIGGTPWLAWMYPMFGEAGAAYLLGVVEIAAALLLIACPWSARAGVAGGALATLTFLVTCSIMFALPIWEPTLGFPALGPAGQFLIKDIALLGIALVVLGESQNREAAEAHHHRRERRDERFCTGNAAKIAPPVTT